mmetsp:Transcript_18751/g.24759  ORF Transcript_18751/g.24759 Transcript_18751/m.24759 type:complete len:173 (+) Transcript_18751:107-625(+)|eukprot:CAMPEP_0117765160 /NCGR_PEP_ID=MMETSP0947-20121206/19920_1 /TAXON_ID=44440 /ORGANISM="Chattonella subsalsa, Strain CCMP2191" /LENGTH=172 /DNA_ID=CAMNT_0005587709 /DNA_START=33 /DNA_END=551 /DNA_ORIENTATION=-
MRGKLCENVIGVFFFLFSVLDLLSSNSVLGAPKRLLFEDAKAVAELDSTEFVKLREAAETCIIDFYSHSCRRCVQWSAIFQTIATELEHLPLKFGAVNCAIYQDLCAEEEITGLPSLRAYHLPNQPETNEPLGVELGKDGGRAAIELYIKKSFAMDSSSGHESRPLLSEEEL